MLADHCRICGAPIRVQIQRGTGYCSQQCQKKKRDDP